MFGDDKFWRIDLPKREFAMKFVLKLLVALVLGAVSATCFPPYSSSVVFLLLCLFAIFSFVYSTNRAGWLLFAFGLGYFLFLLKWMIVVGTDTWVGLALICAFWWGLAGTVIGRIPLDGFWSLKVAFVFTAMELLRDRVPFNGFGWGQFGVVAAQSFLAPLVPILGQVVLTFGLVWIAAEVVRIRKQGAVSYRKYLTIALVVGGAGLASSNMVAVQSADQLRIGLVQGGVVHTGLGTFGPPRSVLKNHVTQTELHIETLNKQDLVVWPESSSDWDPFADPISHSLITAIQAKLETPLLIGANVETSDGRLANDSILWRQTGPHIEYQKRRLVPFGEFMPFRSVISKFTDRVELMPKDFASGHAPGHFNVNGINLNVLICFEIADDSLAFDRIDDAAAIIVHTNNATYQNLGQSEQQLLYARMRALETSRPVLSVSTSGYSAVIDPQGRILDSLNQSQTGILTAVVEKRSGRTLATLLHGPSVVAVFLGLIWSLRSVRFARRKVAS